MSFFFNHLPNTIIVCGLMVVLYLCFGSAARAEDQQKNSYQLSLSFVPERGRLVGTAKITLAPGQDLDLFLNDLEVTGSLLQEENGREYQLRPTGRTLHLPPAPTGRSLYLSYAATFARGSGNLISPEGISLTGNWYPQPDRAMPFQLSATLPDHFSAITEADSFPLKQKGNSVEALFSQPVTDIHFIAGPYLVGSRGVRQGLMVYTMFFKEDQDLAEGYLQAAADYLRRYEQELGPYPYNHYVIVDNRLPTGYGMPTFTLLGQMVLRLPFIKSTSLGHEIVHSWFGNAVEVDSSGGNWCEGLTSYLADHAYRQEKGQGRSDRLETITRYQSYVHKDSATALASFRSASHRQPMAEAKRAVGYDRGAMLFHELQEKIGQKAFDEGLRLFYRENNGRSASWDDLQKSFETVSHLDLHNFFSERLTRKYIPILAVEDIDTEYAGDKTLLSFNLVQQSEQPFTLTVPIRMKMLSGSIMVKKDISEPKTRIRIPVDQVPLELSVDPDFDLFRQLSENELPAVWSRFLGAEKRLVILAQKSDRNLYQPFLDTLRQEGLTITTADAISNRQLSENDLLFINPDQDPCRAIFGPPGPLKQGFTLDVRANPLSSSHVAVLVSSSGREQTAATAPRLNHYGKYSFLHFFNGRIERKTIQETQSGLDFVLEDLPAGAATAALSPFARIVDKLAESRVVYVGEKHTSLPDHLLQQRIIEALYDRDAKLAIGMEMFPASSQPALDAYTLADNEVDERTFLKNSRYFDVWRFDYRYFRDILRFAKKHHLPVIGLNLDSKIVSEVFRSGGTDSLSPSQRQLLPRDRDLAMAGYSERLSLMHAMHMQGSHGSGSASGFIQAQGLWDETMAQNIVDFLTRMPDYRLVVLAGTEHTRKDSGIPPRVERRLAVKQASVLNVSSDSSPTFFDQVADYYFLAEPAELDDTPRIGIVLESFTDVDRTLQKIDRFSPNGKAEAAGLKKGDIVLEVNGYAIAGMSDVRIAMLGTRSGQTIEVKVERAADENVRQLTVKVELTSPTSSPHHP